MITTRVIKVGGSLLDLPDLKFRLDRWRSAQVDLRNIFIAGGGALVETVRDWNRRQPIPDRLAHWICIDLMSANHRFLSRKCFDGSVLTRLEHLPPTVDCVFDPARVLRYELELPVGWHVTSDSIAAAVAQHIRASELVLLKSTAVNSPCVSDWIERGWVDDFFAEASRELPAIRLINLRSDEYKQAVVASK